MVVLLSLSCSTPALLSKLSVSQKQCRATANSDRDRCILLNASAAAAVHSLHDAGMFQPPQPKQASQHRTVHPTNPDLRVPFIHGSTHRCEPMQPASLSIERRRLNASLKAAQPTVRRPHAPSAAAESKCFQLRICRVARKVSHCRIVNKIASNRIKVSQRD